MKSQKDTSAEVLNVAIPEGDSLKHLDCIVAALGKTVSIGTVKSVENVRFPVTQHGQTGAKLVNFNHVSVQTEFV